MKLCSAVNDFQLKSHSSLAHHLGNGLNLCQLCVDKGHLAVAALCTHTKTWAKCITCIGRLHLLPAGD